MLGALLPLATTGAVHQGADPGADGAAGEIQAWVWEQQPEGSEEAVVLVEGLQWEPRK